MRGRSEVRRAFGTALLTALCLAVVVAWPASANIGGVFPTDEDGGTAIEVISADQNLFAYTRTDIQGGDVCIVEPTLGDPGDGSCTRTESVTKAMPRPNGTFRIAVNIAGQSAAVYRLRTKVRQSAAGKRAVNTFTLPRGVNF